MDDETYLQSWARSLACFGGGFIAAFAYIQFFRWQGLLEIPTENFVTGLKVLLVSFAGTAVESLAIKDWDNVTVSVAVAALSMWILAM